MSVVTENNRIGLVAKPNDVVSLALMGILPQGVRKQDKYRSMSFGKELDVFAKKGLPFTSISKKGELMPRTLSDKDFSGLMAEANSWTESGGSFFSRYITTEVAMMWKAFHGGELPLSPLDSSFIDARLSAGRVNGSGYDLVQFGKTILLPGNLKIADVAIRPNGLNDLPMVPPELREQCQYVRSTPYEDEITRRVFVLEAEEILSPLVLVKSSIGGSEGVRLKKLFDSMAKSMIEMRDLVKLKEVSEIGYNPEKSLKIKTTVRSNRIERIPETIGDYGQRMRFVLRREEERRSGEEMIFYRRYSADKPLDLLEMMNESEVTPTSLIKINEKGRIVTKSMQQIVHERLKSLDKRVAASIEEVTRAALVCAEGIHSEINGGNEAQRLNRQNLARVLFSTWPVALLKYYQNYYRQVLLAFSTGRLQMEHPREYYAELVKSRRTLDEY